MVGGLVYGWQNINQLAVLILLTLVAFGYGLMCLYTSQDLQLKTAKVLTVVYSLLMSVVFVGVLVQSVENPVKKTDVTPTPSTYSLKYFLYDFGRELKKGASTRDYFTILQ